jgi:hypothetical protein
MSGISVMMVSEERTSGLDRKYAISPEFHAMKRINHKGDYHE